MSRADRDQLTRKDPQKDREGASLVVQWLRLYTPSAGAQVQWLVRELDPHAATKSLHATTKDPACHNQDLLQPNNWIKKKQNKERQGGRDQKIQV